MGLGQRGVAIVFRVDFFRGERRYIRASDLIASSPLTSAASAFRFGFRRPVCNPGAWRRAGSEGTAGAGEEIGAGLAIWSTGGREDWEFAIDGSSEIGRVLPDIDELAGLEQVQATTTGIACRLTGGNTLCDHIVAALRVLGEKVYPGRRWHVVYLQGTQEALRANYEGASLALEAGRLRGELQEMHYTLDGRPAGRIGVQPR